MKFRVLAIILLLLQAFVVLGGERRRAYLRPVPWYVRPYRYGTVGRFYWSYPYSWLMDRENPYHRQQRVLNSPSLYAGPYPAGGLYTWRQWYYDRLRYPLFDHSWHPLFSVLPYSPELSMAQSVLPDIGDGEAIPREDDPVTKLQEAFFTDDAHSAEDLLQLKLGY
ncbi:MAG: hypothetical protein O2955_05575 [Planctomycetota bacterium]|nr:hypothetical protein [Planctomycetota bacterium]MDA1211962.1 hypothetical protein [Planctomycetota bacterium]